jgi:hypothetical protein
MELPGKNYHNREDFEFWYHCERFVRSNLVARKGIASSHPCPVHKGREERSSQ